MRGWLVVLACASAAAQDGDKVARWIDQLSDDSPQTRERACVQLRAVGKKAEPLLRKARQAASDPEVSRRLDMLLRGLDLEEILGSDVGAEFSDASNPESKLEVLIKHVDRVGGLDLDQKAGHVIAEALLSPGASKQEKVFLLKTIETKTLRVSSWVAAGLSEDADTQVRRAAAATLSALGTLQHVEKLESLLKDSDNEVRTEAARALNKLHASEAKEALRQALKDSDPRVRVDACEALYEIRARDSALEIAGMLADSDPDVRREARDALDCMSCVEAIPQAVKLLEHPKAAVRDTAVVFLVWMRSPEVVPTLLKTIRDEKQDIYDRASAIESLPRVYQAAEDKIAPFLNNANGELRVAAVRGLKWVQTKGSREKVLKAMKEDKDLEVRRAAVESILRMGVGDVETLGQIKQVIQAIEGSPEGNLWCEEMKLYLYDSVVRTARTDNADFVRNLLRDDWQVVRTAGIKGLVAMGDTTSVSEIAKLLVDRNDRVRGLAAEALADLKSSSSAEALRPLLKDKDLGVRAQAAKALGRLGYNDAAPDIAKLLQEEDSGLVLAAAGALKFLSPDKAGSTVRDLLKSSRYTTVVYAADVLAAWGDVEAVPQLVGLVKSPIEFVRRAAAEALGELGSQEQIDGLKPLLRDPYPIVRSAAAQAIGKLCEGQVVADVVELLEDRHALVRQSAVRACWAVKASGLDQKLSKLLQDPDRRVRFEAADALCRRGSRAGFAMLIENAEWSWTDLSVLNALRERQVWNNLSERKLERTLEGSRRSMLERIAQAAGLKLEVEESIPSEHWPIRAQKRGVSPLEALKEALADCNYAFVLEADRIRVLRPAKALEFWRAWK